MSWEKLYKENKSFKDIKFKKLESGYNGYPPFVIDPDLIEIVSLEEFVKIEENRIPLFIGTQHGVYPRINNIPNMFNGGKLIAILGKSLLSGNVAGLRIYKVEEGETEFGGGDDKKVEYFKN